MRETARTASEADETRPENSCRKSCTTAVVCPLQQQQRTDLNFSREPARTATNSDKARPRKQILRKLFDCGSPLGSRCELCDHVKVSAMNQSIHVFMFFIFLFCVFSVFRIFHVLFISSFSLVLLFMLSFFILSSFLFPFFFSSEFPFSFIFQFSSHRFSNVSFYFLTFFISLPPPFFG